MYVLISIIHFAVCISFVSKYHLTNKSCNPNDTAISEAMLRKYL